MDLYLGHSDTIAPGEGRQAGGVSGPGSPPVCPPALGKTKRDVAGRQSSNRSDKMWTRPPTDVIIGSGGAKLLGLDGEDDANEGGGDEEDGNNDGGDDGQNGDEEEDGSPGMSVFTQIAKRNTPCLFNQP